MQLYRLTTVLDEDLLGGLIVWGLRCALPGFLLRASTLPMEPPVECAITPWLQKIFCGILQVLPIPRSSMATVTAQMDGAL